MRRISPAVALPFLLSILFGIGWLAFDWITRSTLSNQAPRASHRDEARHRDDSGEHDIPSTAAIASDRHENGSDSNPSVPGPKWKSTAEGATTAIGRASSGGAVRPVDPAVAQAQPSRTALSRKVSDSSRPLDDGRPRPPSHLKPESSATEPPGPGETPSLATEPEPESDATDQETDTEAPILGEIHFDPAEIRDGGESGVTITATDNLSGVRNVSGSLRSPGSGASVGFTGKRQEGTESWTARIGMPVHAEQGEWFISQVRLQDNANNVGWINWNASTAPQSARLRVVSADADSTPPNVRSIMVERSNLDRGDKNLVRVDVQDDNSGVGSVYGMFSSPNGLASISFHCRPESADIWVGDVSLPKDADCGEWKLRFLTTVDKANNRITLDANDERVRNVSFFLAFSGQCDSTPPVVSLVTITPTTIDNTIATTVSVQVWVTDDASGVRVLTGRVTGPASGSAQPQTINFGFKPGAGEAAPWTSTFVVPQYSAKGHWTIQSIQAIDKANNRRNYTPADPVLSNVGFEVN